MNKTADIFYEQYVLGELSQKKMTELESDPGFEKRIRDIRESDREIFGLYPPSRIVKSIEKKRSGDIIEFRRRMPPRIILPLASAAAAALILFLAIPLLINKSNQPDLNYLTGSETTRIKGLDYQGSYTSPEIRVYRLKNGKPEKLCNNSRAGEGDKLQLSYYLPNKKYGAIFSIDGNGYLTLHYPETGTETVPLETGKETYLPFGYELDNAPDYERFYLILTSEPVSLEKIAGILKQEPAKSIRSELNSLFGEKISVGVYSINIEKR